MIHPQELRIGNKVIDVRGNIETVETLSKTLCGITPNNSCGYDCLYPIPLTDELMVKSGFASAGPGKWEHGSLPITIYWNERMGFYFGGSGAGLSIEYLHQLQNLVHSLSGSELTIKQ